MSNQTRVPANNPLFQAPSSAPEHLSVSDEFAAEDDTNRFAESLADLNSPDKLSNPFAQAMANMPDAQSADDDYIEGDNEVPASPEELADLQEMFNEQDSKSSDEQQDPAKQEELEKARARAEAVQRVTNEEQLFSARKQQEERQTAMALEQTRAQLVQLLVSKGLTDNPTYTQVGMANIVDQESGVGAQNAFERALSGAAKQVEFVQSNPRSGKVWNFAFGSKQARKQFHGQNHEIGADVWQQMHHENSAHTGA